MASSIMRIITEMISKKVIIKVAAIISKSCMQYRNISISYSKVRRNTWVIKTK